MYGSFKKRQNSYDRKQISCFLGSVLVADIDHKRTWGKYGKGLGVFWNLISVLVSLLYISTETKNCTFKVDKFQFIKIILQWSHKEGSRQNCKVITVFSMYIHMYVCVWMCVCMCVYVFVFHDFHFFCEAIFYSTSQSLDFCLTILMKSWLKNYFLTYFLSSSKSVC